MKLGIILQSNNPEHIWNTLRLAIASLKAQHSVQIFLFSEGVEIEDVADTEQFDISKKLREFKELKGIILACETCLNVRSKSESKVCPVTTMRDLVKMIEESDKVLVFG
ncbi:MAG: DsrE family protein [Candidatus Azambacteria bacterium GW2011_GWB2_46_37]|uniref:Uncharacterized protein n=6 Tax=Candidatus Azamiibacteriota TaxID=1752741 RepID=A0A1F5C6R8_9BACT|nr:MAG: DsrE family protein [Candidatus Azambacteria bacterium GW2011_GWA2_45_90]KKU36361.1 MAG: DsrE family protein [Candidatus Azambacteria bacterium GW2011_GWF2_46_32]KKU38251.1 MAG: DsrE family protein [Candidatus Azambacteria bacterium GW2011_GWB2_46_37]KKU39966.1 MAG: DsrE family protein [Candidatus Azambacteria bacterium GW2011_GWE2_46_45]OGD38550.1 MAG: hypothetical protein A3A25_01100 [Candidatus Azambacteria bacterium RIFCSPLOWO2_01_FULL_46_26]OGD45162.1 MAG: hypothetical protein A3J